MDGTGRRSASGHGDSLGGSVGQNLLELGADAVVDRDGQRVPEMGGDDVICERLAHLVQGSGSDRLCKRMLVSESCFDGCTVAVNEGRDFFALWSEFFDERAGGQCAHGFGRLVVAECRVSEGTSGACIGNIVNLEEMCKLIR